MATAPPIKLGAGNMEDKNMARPYRAQLCCVEENNDLVMYCEIQEKRRDPFKRIARRYSGENWISLEPGWTVRGTEPGTNYNIVEIYYSPAGAKAQ